MRIPLGNSQKDIIRKIAANKELLLASQIANEKGVSPAAISQSLSSLLENKILLANEESGRKLLKLSDKGQCYAFLYCGMGFKTIVRNHPYLELPLESIMIEEIIPVGSYNDTDLDSRENWKRAVYRNIFSIIVNHDEFDEQNGRFRYTKETRAVMDGEGNNLGAAGYSMRILRVVNYVTSELVPHHGDWVDSDNLGKYLELARRYFNEFLKFQEGRRKMLATF